MYVCVCESVFEYACVSLYERYIQFSEYNLAFIVVLAVVVIVVDWYA